MIPGRCLQEINQSGTEESHRTVVLCSSLKGSPSIFGPSQDAVRRLDPDGQLETLMFSEHLGPKNTRA